MLKQIKRTTPWCLSKKLPCTACRVPWTVTLVLVFLCVIFACGACHAIESKTYNGTIDFLHKDISFSLDLKEQGRLEALGKVEGDGYALRLILRHLKFGKSDISTELYSTGVIAKTPDDKLKAVKGKIWTQTSLLNFKPLREFSSEYELTGSQLIIHSLLWEGYKLHGRITRAKGDGAGQYPFSGAGVDIDIALAVKEIELKDLAGLLGIGPEVVALEGIVSGQITMRGPQGALKIEAKLTAVDGKVSLIEFKSATIDVEGFWPVLRFVDSQINEVGGVVYQLKGKFNLKELSEFNSAEHQVTVYSANNAMRLQDWVIKRQIDSGGKEMVEAEYSLEKNQALKMRIKDQEELLGWEKKVKF